MATQTKTAMKGSYVFFGGGLHPVKDNAEASRKFSQWRNGNNLSAQHLDPKDGRIYTNGKITAHVAHSGRVWNADKEKIASSMRVAADELDDKGVIASFTKLLMARMMEGDDVTEQLHALNYLRTQAGLKPIVIPAGGVGGGAAAPKKEAPRSEQRRQEPPRSTPPPSSGGTGMVINVPHNAQMLPDGKNWKNRFKIPSSSSDRLYTIAQSKGNGHWGCDCPGWISRRNCKHLRALGLPGNEVPFEATLKQGSKKTAGKFKLYTGPTIVKQTADELRNAGINVTVEGTEHVHFLADGDRDQVTFQLRDILGPQWGVRNVQQLASTKQGADMIHSDNDLSLKLEPASATEPPKVEGPEAGPSNDEMYANGHSENGEAGSPVFDGNLKSPERQNVNAIREALETQVEMEVGKPIEQKQEEVAMQEKVQDAALAQGAGGLAGGAGTAEVSAKPGTQIIINVASKKKAESMFEGFYDQAQPIRDAVDELRQEIENECPECDHPLPHAAPYGCEVERGDHPGGEGDHGPYGEYAMGPCGCKYGLKVGSEKEAAMRVRISEGSGIDGGKEGIIIPWEDPRAREVREDYPFVGGRTPQGMGWVAILTDQGEVTTVPKGNVQQVKRSAEPIGGEPEQQSGVTSGNAGGMFGGTDLEGPSFHVGFVFKGYHREASFTSLAEADKFLTTASKKFGKLAGDWTMKCPHCGKTASKDKPTDNYKCPDCGWDSAQAKSSGLLATPALGSADFQQGYADGWNQEGPAHEENEQYSTGYWKGYDDKIRLNKTSSDVDPAHRTLVYTLLKTGPKTTGEIEKALGGGKYTNKAYPILTEMAKDGIVSHKQMRWSLKQAKTGAATAEGWSNWETETVNLYITNDRKTYDQWWSMAQEAVKVGMTPQQLADEYKVAFASKERQFIREQNEEQQSENNFTNVAPTNWLEIAMDAMQYVRNEEKAGEINRDRREGPAEQRFQTMMEPGDDLHAKGMGISLSSLRTATICVKVGGGVPQKGTPEWHQVQIAIKTLKMPAAMQGVMGQSAEDAARVLARFGLRWDNEEYMAGGKGVKKAGDGMAKTETELEKEAGFNFFFPGQVLKEFYPEIQHEIVDYPNANNQPMGLESPEIVGDGGHELEGVLDEALDTNIIEMIQLPADVEGPFSMAAADYSSTSPAGGMGIGRDGKPEVLEGVPLRKENDIRGYMFTDEFYGQYQGIPGAAMAVASKTAAGGEAKQFSEFLNFVCGEIAATMVAAFKVTHRPLLDKIPGIGEIQLDQIEQGAGVSMPIGQITQGGRIKFLLDQLNDSEIKEAINSAWAQSAVWHDGGDGGFVYEVFVRPETIDTDSLKMKYKFVCGTKG